MSQPELTQEEQDAEVLRYMLYQPDFKKLANPEYMRADDILRRLRKTWNRPAADHLHDDEFVDMIIRDYGELLAFRQAVKP